MPAGELTRLSTRRSRSSMGVRTREHHSVLRQTVRRSNHIHDARRDRYLETRSAGVCENPTEIAGRRPPPGSKAM
jgi:hypothetical protein